MKEKLYLNHRSRAIHNALSILKVLCVKISILEQPTAKQTVYMRG
jgi:hypothetical protein